MRLIAYWESSTYRWPFSTESAGKLSEDYKKRSSTGPTMRQYLHSARISCGILLIYTRKIQTRGPFLNVIGPITIRLPISHRCMTAVTLTNLTNSPPILDLSLLIQIAAYIQSPTRASICRLTMWSSKMDGGWSLCTSLIDIRCGLTLWYCENLRPALHPFVCVESLLRKISLTSWHSPKIQSHELRTKS